MPKPPTRKIKNLLDNSLENEYNKNMELLVGIVGSHAYGYATPESDIDYMRVFVSPITSYFGLDRVGKASQKVTEEVDTTSYELIHFVSLCTKFNPNVIPLLFLESNQYTYVHPVMTNLLNNRNLFISQYAFNTLFGYSVSQYKKTIEKITGNLGERRKELIAKYGYDVKAAAHVIRLLMTGVHLFTHGEVDLKCAAYLCSQIRNGEYTFREFEILRSEAMKMFEDSFSNNKCVPPEPDFDQINTILVETLENYFYAWNKKE